MLVDICIPCHNEELILEKNILHLLNFCQKQNFSFTWRIIIIVNGSSDKSAIISEKLALKYQAIIARTIISPGKSNAVNTAWQESPADIFAYMDSDLAVSLQSLPPLLTPLLENKADMVVGCRLHKQSNIKRSLNREIISRSYNFLARLFLHNPCHDLQCGFKAIKSTVFRKLSPHITDTRWFFDTELITWAYYFNYKILEIPVNWEEARFRGRSSTIKIFRDSTLFIKNLYTLRKKLFVYKNKASS